MARVYRLRSRWRVASGRDALWDVVEELLAGDDPLSWWGAVEVVTHDGTTMVLRARSRFGYILDFTLTDLEMRRPDILRFASTGDLEGRGVVGFVPCTPASCDVVIDWHVGTRRRWMRATTWVLWPVFVLGHRLVMAQGRRRLNRWLAARRLS